MLMRPEDNYKARWISFHRTEVLKQEWYTIYKCLVWKRTARSYNLPVRKKSELKYTEYI